MDILAVSETFVCEKTPKMFYEIPGYKFFHKDRTMKSRGGVGLYVKEGIVCKEIKLCKDLVQPEILFVEITCDHTKLAVGVIYKTPKVSYTQFAAVILTKYEHHILMGDYNIDHLRPDSSACKFFKEHITEPFDLTQLITDPTQFTHTHLVHS